ncbi:MAG: hypothetical protein PHO58_05025 [Bacilli bacterium]|nr:hypothetical protein [Bacilli bacterium]
MLEKLKKIQNLLNECIEELSNSDLKTNFNKQKNKQTTRIYPDFSLNERAFIKKYGKTLSGPKQFVLLVSYIAKGDNKNIVKSEDITKEWNRLSSFMVGGKSQRNFSTRAKENGWIDSPKHGSYTLSKNWTNIFA